MTIMMTVTSKGQVTFPKSLRELLGVEKGDRVIAKVEDKKVMLEKAGKGLLDLVGKMPKLRIPKGKTVDDLINDARDEYFRKTFR